MANTATIKVLVDDKALESLVNKSQQTAKIIRGGFDIATGAAAVFGDKSAAAMEKLANRAILVATTFNGIEDLIEGLAKQEGFLRMAQKVGVGKEAVEGFAKALPGIGIAATLLIPILQEVFERTAKNARVTAEEIEKVSGKFTDQKTEVDLLVREYNKSNTSLDRQREIIKDLNKLSPNYFSTSIKNSEELTKQQNKYNKALLTEITLQANKAKISEILGKKQGDIIELEQEITRLQSLTDLQAVRNLGFTGNLETAANREELIKQGRAKLAKRIIEIRGEIKILQNELLKELKPFEDAADKAAEALDKLGGTTETPSGGGGGGKSKVVTKKKEEVKDLEKIRKEQFQKELDEIINLNNRIALEFEKRGQDTTVVQVRSLEEQIALYKKYGLDTVKLEQELLRLTKQEQKKVEPTDAEKENQAYLVLFGVDKKTFEDVAKKYDENKLKEKEIADLRKRSISEAIDTAKNVGALLIELSNQRLDSINKLYEGFNSDLDKQEELALKRADKSEQSQQRVREKFAAERVQLEEKQAAETLRIRKKQADVELALGLIDVAAKTAQSLSIGNANPAVALDPTLVTVRSIYTGIVLANAAAQTAVLIAQRAAVNKLAGGGMLVGPSHANGGIYMGGGVEAEGGEAVINRRSSRMFGGLLSAVNQAGGGVPIMPGESIKGGINTTSSTIIDYDALASAMARNPVKAFVVTQDVTLAQDKQTAIKSKATIA